MSVFTQAVNGFRSTASREGKFYNSVGANRAKAVAGYMASEARIMPKSMGLFYGSGAVAGAGVAGAGAVLTGSDHKGRRAAQGAMAGGGVMVGLNANRVWKGMTPAIRGLLR